MKDYRVSDGVDSEWYEAKNAKDAAKEHANGYQADETFHAATFFLDVYDEDGQFEDRFSAADLGAVPDKDWRLTCK